jgi:magnesium-protoporphyrin O-methyltransferase
MHTGAYLQRRNELEQYFDRTAVQAWERLTSDAPVSRIRASVRAGRARMRQTILDLLAHNLSGRRILDAGCGTGALSLELAARGAHVVGIDLSATLVELARRRGEALEKPGAVEFRNGDMCDPSLGFFDHVVAMDSLIHYDAPDIVQVLTGFAARTRHSIVFTFAPRTTALALMHAIGRAFPRGNRAPAIAPLAQAQLQARIAREPGLQGWRLASQTRIAHGFYTSQASQLVRA